LINGGVAVALGVETTSLAGQISTSAQSELLEAETTEANGQDVTPRMHPHEIAGRSL